MTTSTSASETAQAFSDADLLEMLSHLREKEQELAQEIVVERVMPGDCIAPAEEMPKYLYVVSSGMVQILITSPEGRRLVTSVLGPGAVFGEEALFKFDANGPSYCAQSVSHGVLWKIPAELATKFLLQEPVLRLAMLRTMGVRMVQVENRLEEVAYRWLPERLAAELIRQNRYAKGRQIRLSHQALADILGTYRETISAILRDFREAGWVKLGYRRIILLNPEALQELTGVVRE